MQQAAAVVLVLSFCLPAGVSMLSALSASSAGNLPPCCRRNGKHHCTMRTMLGTAGHHACITVAPPVERCPFFPQAVMPVVLPGHLSPPPETRSAEAWLRSRTATAAQTEAEMRILFARSRQKRGPPFSLLSL